MSNELLINWFGFSPESGSQFAEPEFACYWISIGWPWPLMPMWHTLTHKRTIASFAMHAPSNSNSTIVGTGSRKISSQFGPTRNFNKLTKTAANIISDVDDRHEFIWKVVFFLLSSFLLPPSSSTRCRSRSSSSSSSYFSISRGILFIPAQVNYLADDTVKLVAPAREHNFHSINQYVQRTATAYKRMQNGG